MSRAAADLIGSAVRAGATTLGVATGSSPLGTYAELGRRVAAGGLSLAGCDAYLLDEYVGLGADHPQAYRCVIRRELVRRTDLGDGHVHGPHGDADDLDAEARRFEEEVRRARIGVQVLGIGSNGHLGFNEPGSPLDSLTRVVELTERTRADNARFFDRPEDVPRRVLTQGLGTILRAERLVLLALGERKADALAAALTGPVNPDCPASVLQCHPDVHVLADPGAARGLLDSPRRR
ncbi:glucosamine-6-phosphate deaminase [Nocardioides mesophilus]|uniref:glucosamine-6-phosphate deaminase n=1 Tax=Nocardioides mesophilus TaxID=433659 RepID=UPI001CB7417C|nr:glucosamine-6-phosphate deaminase [Nocardioides mesophilus]